MKSCFDKMSVAFPMNEKDLDHLNEADKEKILNLISRISEKSFRRGFQHGYHYYEYNKNAKKQIFDFRFTKDLGRSFWIKTNENKQSSIERLFMEYGPCLENIGLKERF